MSALKQDRLVRSDLAKAFHWYEDQSAGLGRDLLARVRSLFAASAHGPAPLKTVR